MTRPAAPATVAPMFPIRDHNPTGGVPIVTYTLIALNILAFAYTSLALTDPRALGEFYWDWAIIPIRISNGEGYMGLVTSMFLHGGIMHLGGNLLFLWIFGDNLEEQMGKVGFVAFYLATGLAAGLLQVVSEPMGRVPTIGASGAIAGVMGGYLLLFPKAKVDVFIFFVVFFRILPLPAWIMLALWFAIQLFGGFGGTDAGVAYFAHIGGFVAGVVLAVPVWLRRGGRVFWERTHGHPPHEEARYARSSIPVVRRGR